MKERSYERNLVAITLGRKYTRLWQVFHCDECPTEHGAGGYSFWRCRRLRFHPGAHRFRNYVWPKGERVTYDPIPISRYRGRRWFWRPRRGYQWLTGRVKSGTPIGYGPNEVAP